MLDTWEGIEYGNVLDRGAGLSRIGGVGGAGWFVGFVVGYGNGCLFSR